MIISTTVDLPSLTVKLERGMSVTIRDDGSVTVRQASRDLPGDMIDMGGEYELTLPDVSTVAATCSAKDADPGSYDFPASGTTTIPVTHLH